MTYFETLIKDARREADDSEYGTANLLRDLAVSLEVMVAENESLRRQLDGMTTEWGSGYIRDVENRPVQVTDAEQEARSYTAMRNASNPRLFHVVKRLVGPWVEVE